MARSKHMRRLLLVVLPTLFFDLSTSIPVGANTLLEDFAAWKRQHGGVFSVRGMSAFGDQAVHPRLEIRELEKDKDKWNVFLLGLQRFQNVDQNDPLSYFQIAGIHGMPFQAWDGVDGAEGISDGYCPHRHHLFPTWHRPFLALIEEVIYLNARQAISEFPDGDLKSRYSTSLTSWRLPYWDWAAVPPNGQSCYPASVQSPEVEITMPSGSKKIPNPLFAYTFHPLPDWKSDPDWQASPTTVRQPAMRAETYTDYQAPQNATNPYTRTRMVRDPNAPSRNEIVAQNLDRNRKNIQLRVYNLLAFEHDYLKMSSEVQGPNNIENIHGTIHNTIGGSGHMWNLRYSAFDPIFWMHHSNVDRLFAIWQMLNPNYTVPSWTNTAQTFTMPAGTPTDGNTPLKPFHKNEAGAFWTSNDLTTTLPFAYTYPILQSLSETDTLTRRINTLYSPQKTIPTTHRARLSKRHPAPATAAHAAIAHAVAFGAGVQYTLRVRASQRSLARSPSVLVYLGDAVPPDGSMDAGAEDVPPEGEEQPLSFVGKTSFVMQNVDVGDEAEAGRTSAAERADVQSVVPLTGVLEERVLGGALEGMGEEAVGGYLRAHLSWRIAMANDKNVTSADVDGFDISVVWREVVPALSLDEFPQPLGEEKVLLRQTVMEAGDGRFV